MVGLRGLSFLLPFATIPYVSRVLGPASWGLVAFSQSFALYVSLMV